MHVRFDTKTCFAKHIFFTTGTNETWLLDGKLLKHMQHPLILHVLLGSLTKSESELHRESIVFHHEGKYLVVPRNINLVTLTPAVCVTYVPVMHLKCLLFFILHATR